MVCRPILEPGIEWLSQFVPLAIRTALPYHLEKNAPQARKLDQNEMAFDWPLEIKQEICDQLRDMPWNRYPSPFSDSLEKAVAQYCQVDPSCILSSPGSNLLITLILQCFGTELKGNIWITRPSFSLFELYCRTFNLAYKTWDLDDQGGFNIDLLKSLRPHSLVMFASPNNPTGGALAAHDLEVILTKYPHTLFVADEAYYEFRDDDYTGLLSKHSNLVIIRTFSKALGAAGIRMGYILAAPQFIAELRKIRLPYLCNYFTEIAVKTLLSNPTFNNSVSQRVQFVKAQRTLLFDQLQLLSKESNFKVYPSQANFLLLKWVEFTQAQEVHKLLVAKKITIRNVSQSPHFMGSLRISIGSEDDNQSFIAAFKEVLLRH